MDLQRHVILDLRLIMILLESQLLRDGGGGGKGYGCIWKEERAGKPYTRAPYFLLLS